MPAYESDRDPVGGKPGILLRPYAKEDFAAVFALDQACFPAAIAYSESELRYYLRHPRCFTVVAETGNQVAGFVLTERTKEAGRPAGHLITIDVAPEARRLGLGSRLLADVEQKLTAGDAASLALEVAIDNEPAKRFYERHGFIVTGRIPGYYAGKIDALTMAKPLLP